jgi:hypothetical protein
VSGDKPVFDDPEVVGGIKDALRSKLGREPTSAEVSAMMEQRRRIRELNANAKKFWDEQNPPPAPPDSGKITVAEALRMTVRETLREAGTKQVSEAAKKRRKIGEETLKRVRIAAVSYEGSTLSRERVAQLVARVVELDEQTTLKLLRKLKIPT